MYGGAWRRFRRHLPAMIGLLILLVLGLAALAAPLLTPYDPVRQQLPQALRSPSLTHPLGTDHLGRYLLVLEKERFGHPVERLGQLGQL